MSQGPTDANEILRELLRLQAEQTELLVRLLALPQLGQNPARQAPIRPVRSEPEAQARQVNSGRIEIGSPVRIKNPRPSQPSKGVVVNIDPNYVTVESADGTHTKRAPHNIEVLRGNQP